MMKTARNNRILHYIPPAKMPEIVQEFVQPVPDDYFIHWLFRYRCMGCGKPGQEINEIKPRGRSKQNILDWKNRVVLCRICHTEFHHGGVTQKKMDAMVEKRKTFLTSIGRGAYL